MLNIYSVTRNSNLLVEVIQVKCCEFWECIQAPQRKCHSQFVIWERGLTKLMLCIFQPRLKNMSLLIWKVEIHTDFLIYLVSGMLSLK